MMFGCNTTRYTAIHTPFTRLLQRFTRFVCVPSGTIFLHCLSVLGDAHASCVLKLISILILYFTGDTHAPALSIWHEISLRFTSMLDAMRNLHGTLPDDHGWRSSHVMKILFGLPEICVINIQCSVLIIVKLQLRLYLKLKMYVH